jgi:hypothetical protein
VLGPREGLVVGAIAGVAVAVVGAVHQHRHAAEAVPALHTD